VNRPVGPVRSSRTSSGPRVVSPWKHPAAPGDQRGAWPPCRGRGDVNVRRWRTSVRGVSPLAPRSRFRPAVFFSRCGWPKETRRTWGPGGEPPPSRIQQMPATAGLPVHTSAGEAGAWQQRAVMSGIGPILTRQPPFRRFPKHRWVVSCGLFLRLPLSSCRPARNLVGAEAETKRYSGTAQRPGRRAARSRSVGFRERSKTSPAPLPDARMPGDPNGPTDREPVRDHKKPSPKKNTNSRPPGQLIAVPADPAGSAGGLRIGPAHGKDAWSHPGPALTLPL